jgi:hypothetical protein
VEKKKGHKHHPKKKARARPFVLARFPLTPKQKVGVEQEEGGHIRWANT